MQLSNIFKDSNDINEKSVIGFLAFAVMVLFAIADTVIRYFGHTLAVSNMVYNSFVILCAGAFGFSSIDKYTNLKKNA